MRPPFFADALARARPALNAARYTARTVALTGRDPTGITVSKEARRLRFFVIAPTRSTATSPELRLSTSAY
jgi:hypothetical protein